MSEHDKMMAFGHWLQLRRENLKNELVALATDRAKPVDAVRIKAGHIEDCTHVLVAFTELYNGELNKFMEGYLGQPPSEEEESTDESTNTA